MVTSARIFERVSTLEAVVSSLLVPNCVVNRVTPEALGQAAKRSMVSATLGSGFIMKIAPIVISGIIRCLRNALR